MGRYMTTAILACLFLASSVFADAESDTPGLFGIFSPKPGAWSEYAIFDKSTGRRSVIRMSIVDIEADAYWYEVENREEGGSNIVKMLVKGDPGDPDNMQRLIIKTGTHPAQEMDLNSMPMGAGMASSIFEQWSGISSSARGTLRNVNSGMGTATVPAGTFAVSLHQVVDKAGEVYAEYEYSEDVHPFGVVTSDSENSTIVLVNHGTGAKSFITEEPTMVTQFQGMPERIPEEMPSGMGQHQDTIPDPGNNIRQIPGMGRGYESRQ